MNLDEQVLRWLAERDLTIYLVGGCVRDRIMERPIHDLDVAVDRNALALARRLADQMGGAYYPLDRERGTGRAILKKASNQLVVDIAQFRGLDLAQDLADRDFTINALAANVRTPHSIIDHHRGLHDLEAGIIRPVTSDSIRNDPLRALRAVRQGAELGFALAPLTEALIRRDGPALSNVPGERIRDELSRILVQENAAPHLRRLDALGLLTVVLPALEPLRDLSQPPPHHLDALDHSLQTVHTLESILASLGSPGKSSWDETIAEMEEWTRLAPRVSGHLYQILGADRPRLVVLKLAALLHDTGKAASKMIDEEGRLRFFGHDQEGAKIITTTLQDLRFNRAEVRLGQTIVAHHMRPLLLANQDSVSTRAIYRFFRATSDAGVEILMHALADHRATFSPPDFGPRWPVLLALAHRMLTTYWSQQESSIAPAPLLDGNDLIELFDIQPGPQIGWLLAEVREAQIVGEIHSRQEALAWIHAHLTSHGSA